WHSIRFLPSYPILHGRLRDGCKDGSPFFSPARETPRHDPGTHANLRSNPLRGSIFHSSPARIALSYRAPVFARPALLRGRVHRRARRRAGSHLSRRLLLGEPGRRRGRPAVAQRHVRRHAPPAASLARLQAPTKMTNARRSPLAA